MIARKTAIKLQVSKPVALALSATLRKSLNAPAEVKVSLAEFGLPEASEPTATIPVLLPKTRTASTIAQVDGQMFCGGFCNGVAVVALPVMQTILGLEEGLLVWIGPSYFLTAGSYLLVAGSIADIVANKRVNLLGSCFSAIFAMDCCFSSSGSEIVPFRAILRYHDPFGFFHHP